MHNEFKNGSEVFVDGPGQKDEIYYKNKKATIIECDPYFKDYLVRFKDGKEDWILAKYIRKPYDRKKGNKK